ncbi:MAG: hypothetical protein WAV32_03370 [Halobacteriota archaeon]
MKNAIWVYYECIRRNMNHAAAHNQIAWMLSTSKLKPDRAIELANRLADAGMDPWLEKRKLLLADNYECEIKIAIEHLLNENMLIHHVNERRN